MPTYEYHCDSCDKNFDVVQSFHDDPLTACPTCGSPVRKVFGSVGIVFKGSGFYKTDSRSGGSSKAPAGDGDSTGTSGSENAASESSTPAAAPSGDSAAKPSTTETKGKGTSTKPSAPAAPAKSSAKDSGS